ncbi:hypothetical protein BHE18_20475 [Rossellomorea aquimaris]|jgi:hypothetical protein|uniref:Uncharacterized protein n=1 Tax=Rossellomorea aquimaris TaxID=189382 RepID=A0A1J6WSI5_9BACI|nr:hypothetical protein BHE18_20475 [Rossellomorea aquimaris]
MQDKEILNLHQYRLKKQRIAEEQIDELYRQAFEYALKETNIREKVRAKMIFADRFHMKEPSLVSKKAEDVFHQWFLFDYKTIKGQTLFFQFLQSQKFSEPVKMIGALLLTAAPEPLLVTGIQSGEREILITGKNIIHVKEESVKTSISGRSEEIRPGSTYFVRKVPLVTDQWLIGPVFEAAGSDFPGKIKEDYHLKNHENGVLWRTFLKEEAPSYILKGDSPPVHGHRL